MTNDAGARPGGDDPTVEAEASDVEASDVEASEVVEAGSAAPAPQVGPADAAPAHEPAPAPAFGRPGDPDREQRVASSALGEEGGGPEGATPAEQEPGPSAGAEVAADESAPAEHSSLGMPPSGEAGTPTPPLQRTRSRRRGAGARALLLAAGAAALTVAATRTDARVTLAQPQERAGLPQQSRVLVDSATLVCPGQLRLGAPGMRDVPGVTTVAAFAAPTSALDPVARPVGAGRVDVSAGTAAADGASVSTQSRSTPAQAGSTGTGPVFVRATGALAPGVAATQTWERLGDDDRGLALTACRPPASDVWLVAGGAGPSRTERLVVANPGANAVTVTFDVYGSKGVVGGRRAPVAVPPRSRMVFSIEAIAPGEPSPAVHVVATGGVLSAVLTDEWIAGATARGIDAATQAAAPARDLVVPGVDAGGSVVLRLVNPGPRAALAQVRILTRAGAQQPPELRAVEVPAGSTRDVVLALPPGSPSGVRVLSDAPLTAGVYVDRVMASGLDRMGDFTWVPAVPQLDGVGGAVLPAISDAAALRRLVVTGGSVPGTATVTVGQGQEERTATVQVAADGAAHLDLGAADRVWVTGTDGIRAAVEVAAVRDGVPQYAVVPVESAPLTSVTTPVRQVSY